VRKLRLILLALAFLSLALGYALHSEQALDEKAMLRDREPGRFFSAKQGSPPLYRSDSLVAFNSHDIAPSIRGYAGPIKLMLVLGPDGLIRGIRIIEHRETKNYVHYLETPQFLNQFLGKRVTDAFVVDRDIDGVTRATVSAEALARTVRESARIVAAQEYNIQAAPDDAAANRTGKWIVYALLFSATLALYFITRRSKKLLRLRDLCLAAGIAIIGLYLATPFSILHVFNLLFGRLSSDILWYVLVLSVLLSFLIVGRFYCGWLCPFGALSEFISRVPIQKWNISPNTDEQWRRAKYLLLGLIVVLVFVSRQPEFGNFEAYITLFSFHGSILAWLLVGLTLVANLRVKRFWCRYLCPIAALSGLLSRSAPGYLGSADCPMANRMHPEISECIRCHRCYAAREADRGR